MKSLTAIGALLAIAASGQPADAHRITAAGGGVTCYDDIPCDATRIDGDFQIGVPGVNPNYFNFTSTTDSDSGYLWIASAFSWVEGTRPGSTKFLTDVIEESVTLQRIAPGPVTIRAMLVLEGGGHMVDDGTVRLNGTLSFGCQIYASKLFTSTISTDLEATGSPCGELIGSALVVTTTYEGNLPTSLELRAQLQADYDYVFLGTVADFQWRGDLSVELINATATWDTPTFLTQAPEPEAGALGAAAGLALALRAGTRRRTERRQR
jgi:hypothetical protein